MKTNVNIPLFMLILFLGGVIGLTLSDLIFGDQSSFIAELCIKAAVVALCDVILYLPIMAIAKRAEKK